MKKNSTAIIALLIFILAFMSGCDSPDNSSNATQVDPNRMREFIFYHSPSDNLDSALLKRASQIAGDHVNVAFRASVHPGKIDELEKLTKYYGQNGYNYYLTAMASDFIDWGDTGKGAWEPSMLAKYAANPNFEGFYLHEVAVHSLVKQGDLSEVNFDTIEEYCKLAKANGKKVLWSEWGYGCSKLKENKRCQELLAKYPDVLVPIWANNNPEGNELARQSVKSVANKYTGGTYGASLQDWYWEEKTGQPKESMPKSEHEKQIERADNDGASYFQFEHRWDKGEFLSAIEETANKINGNTAAGSTCAQMVSPCKAPPEIKEAYDRMNAAYRKYTFSLQNSDEPAIIEKNCRQYEELKERYDSLRGNSRYSNELSC